MGKNLTNMKIYDRNEMLPRLWWLFPWATACELHRIAKASLEWGDHADRGLEIQARVIDDQSGEIRRLRERVSDLYDDIMAGRACVADATPVGARLGADLESASTDSPEG